jgi:predicted dinucleotide-binding enzyme
VNIGIIGSGNMGAGMGKIWAAKGHKVLFSFSTDQEKLRAVAAAAGAAVPEALKAAGDCEGKTLFSCVN